MGLILTQVLFQEKNRWDLHTSAMAKYKFTGVIVTNYCHPVRILSPPHSRQYAKYGYLKLLLFISPAQKVIIYLDKIPWVS